MIDPSHPPRSLPRVWPFKGTYYGWAIVAAGFAASFGEVPAFGPILGIFIHPIEEELGWTRATIAWGFLIGSVTGALASIVVGRFVDRYGSRVVVAIAGVLITGALLGLSAINEPWQFWLFFGIARGSAVAGVEIGTSVAIAKWFYRKRARTLGLKGVGQRTGQALAPFLILAVMSASDWRTSYVVLAGFSAVLITIPSLLLIRRQPEDFGLEVDGGVVASNGGISPAPEVSWTLAEARRTKAFWLLVFFTVCTPFVQGATNLHLVANFQDQGLSDFAAVSVLSVFAWSSALSIMPMGFLLERIHVRFGGMLQAIVLFASMAIVLVADTYIEAVAFAILFGMAAGMRNIVETLLFANYFGRASLGSIRGFAAPFRAIGPIGPVLAGFVRDETGSYSIAFIIFLGVATLMLLAMILATPPPLPRKTVPDPQDAALGG